MGAVVVVVDVEVDVDVDVVVDEVDVDEVVGTVTLVDVRTGPVADSSRLTASSPQPTSSASATTTAPVLGPGDRSGTTVTMIRSFPGPAQGRSAVAGEPTMWRRSLARRGVRADPRGVDATTDLTPTVLDAVAMAQLTSEPFGPRPGAATNTVLWRDGTAMAGLLTVAAGERLGEHTHHHNHHHMWVVRGSARIVGTLLGAGGYVHVPAGVEHDIDATGTDGCTVFYLYQRPSP